MRALSVLFCGLNWNRGQEALSIKAIVFDYGQVISLPQDPKAIDALAQKAGVERGKFEPVFLHLRKDYDRGTVSAREYIGNVLSHFDIKMDEKGIDEMIAMDLDSWKQINPETVALMEELKERGYTLGILSNMPNEFLCWARSNAYVFSLPQKSLFSCEVNLLKPGEAIYRRLLSLFELEGEEIVFFDDSEENAEGARKLGIKAFLWTGAEKARSDLLSVGVRL